MGFSKIIKYIKLDEKFRDGNRKMMLNENCLYPIVHKLESPLNIVDSKFETALLLFKVFKCYMMVVIII